MIQWIKSLIFYSFQIFKSIFRSRSTSTASGKSTYAGSEVNSHEFTHDLRFDSADERILEEKLVVKSKELILKDPPLSCKVEDKENILNPLKEIKRKRHRKKESEQLHTKMPPTTTTTKLPGRQTNNSLSSITGQIVIQAPPTPAPADIPVVPTTSRKKKTKAEV